MTLDLPSPASPALDVHGIRKHFAFAEHGRIVTNNAATTQAPRAAVEHFAELAASYEAVHRGQSSASRAMTALLDDAYATVSELVNAPSPRSIVFCRNTTEALNLVMYTLMGELRSGDNVVTTLLEHNSNYVPWYALSREILPRFGVNVECRLARFDAEGRIDLEHLAALIDERTKLVTVTGASNFFGTKQPLNVVRELARASGYVQPSGVRGSRFVVDGAQLAPTTAVDVQALDADYFAFSLHKMLAPFGVGVLYAKEELLAAAPPFLYGGDMIAEGRVAPERVEYNALPWKYGAGTPNVLGIVASAQAVRLLLDLAHDPEEPRFFKSRLPLERVAIERAFRRIGQHTRALTTRALDGLRGIPRLTLYGPLQAAHRTPLVAFNVAGRDPFELAEGLALRGVEARAGCHCATLAHRALGLDPPASCRLSFFFYNTEDDVEAALAALSSVVAPRSHIAVVPGAAAARGLVPSVRASDTCGGDAA